LVRALVGQYRLTAYDASYLELAIRHKLPLAASYNALAKATRAAGIDMVQL
jgi:predicted nucleic acid-binding protein